MAEDFKDLIDRLGAAALECREQVREAHAATKDLRQAVKEAKAEINSLADTVWDERLTVEVREFLARYGVTMDKAVETGTQAVLARFDTLRDILLGEGKERQGKHSIPELIDRKMAKARGSSPSPPPP